MTEDSLPPFDLPAVQRKKVTADFAGGSISSDGGLVLLRAAERRLGLAEALAGCIREWRDPDRVVHSLPAMPRFRMFAIACGYEDADDCDALRGDPLFKLAVGRAPESGRDLCSQPTMSRLENAPSRSEVARMTAALVDIFCRSFPSRRRRSCSTSTTPAIRCTANSSCRCSTPITTRGASFRCMSTMSRAASRWRSSFARQDAVGRRGPHPAEAPGPPHPPALAAHPTHLPGGFSHYGRTEAMDWCEANGVDYIFGLAGNPALHGFAYGAADDLKVRRAEAGADKIRGFASPIRLRGPFVAPETPGRRPAGSHLLPRGFDAALHRHLAHGQAAAISTRPYPLVPADRQKT